MGPFKGIWRGGGVSEREIPLASAGNLLLREASGGDTKAQGIGPTTIFDRGAALTIGIFAAAVTRCGDPEFGPMVRLVRLNHPTPLHDCARTTDELGRPPTSLIEGLGLTIEWLRQNGRLWQNGRL